MTVYNIDLRTYLDMIPAKSMLYPGNMRTVCYICGNVVYPLSLNVLNGDDKSDYCQDCEFYYPYGSKYVRKYLFSKNTIKNVWYRVIGDLRFRISKPIIYF